MLSHRLVLAGMAGHNPPLECEAYINDEPAVQAVDFVEVGSGPSALHPPVTAFRAFDPAPPHGDPRWACLLSISEERLLEAGVSPRPPDRAVALPPPELIQKMVQAPDASTELLRAWRPCPRAPFSRS